MRLNKISSWIATSIQIIALCETLICKPSLMVLVSILINKVGYIYASQSVVCRLAGPLRTSTVNESNWLDIFIAISWSAFFYVTKSNGKQFGLVFHVPNAICFDRYSYYDILQSFQSMKERGKSSTWFLWTDDLNGFIWLCVPQSFVHLHAYFKRLCWKRKTEMKFMSCPCKRGFKEYSICFLKPSAEQAQQCWEKNNNNIKPEGLRNWSVFNNTNNHLCGNSPFQCP